MADVPLSSIVGGGIKQVQRGVNTVTTGATVNVTISAIDMDKSFIVMSIRNSAISSTAAMCTAEITSATNLALVSGTSQDSVVSWEVIEYE